MIATGDRHTRRTQRPAFSRWLKEPTSIDGTDHLPHQDAKIAPIQPVGWNAMLDGLRASL
jgi:hypothetical protein